MSTAAQNDSPSFLFQILEKEYGTLHGSLPTAYLQTKDQLRIQGRSDEELDDALVSEWYRYIPRPLYRVLEEEYQALHGPLPENYKNEKRRILNQHPKPDNMRQINEALASALHRCFQEKRTAALCLSGGGIRSATFGLGVLQGLARRGLLDQFHYLSTVSGGGYIGSWLTSWIHRKTLQEKRDGLPAVVTALKNDPPKPKLDPEPPPIRHLREYSNYLTPQLGFFSADTWALIATYLRNLFVNWFVWLPLLILTLLLPRFIVAVTAFHPGNRLIFVDVLLIVGFIPVLVSLAYICLNLPSVRQNLGDYHHLFQGRHDQDSFLIWCLIPLLFSAFCLTSAWAWLNNMPNVASDTLSLTGYLLDWKPLAAFLAIGVFVHVLGWATAIGFLLIGKPAKDAHSRGGAIRKYWDAYHLSEFFAIVVSGAVGGLATWALATEIFPAPSDHQHILLYTCFAPPLLLFSFMIGGAVYVGLAGRWTSDDDREWWGRSSGWILIAVLAWVGLNAVVVFAPPFLLETPKILGSVGGVTGLITLLLGFSGKTGGTNEETEKGGWKTALLTVAPILAAPVALLLLAAFLALLTSWAIHALPGIVFLPADLRHRELFLSITEADIYRMVFLHTDGWRLLGLAALLIVFVVPMSVLINVNKFSLHSIYRNRLIRAYLGASHVARRPNSFTGFDPHDNIEMHKLLPQSRSDASGPRLLHVVNIALNLVGKKKERLAWQERKAESFTVTPLHVGNWQLGYRRTKEYGKSQDGQSITLGTAISISGAAASPNMGYHSSPVVTLLMTLFNVRLGWWLGNPGKAGAKTFNKPSPTFSIGPMIYEALGFTNDDYKYVYLSDGGHFENLGLYEMVLRHCHFILAIDSGRDPEFAFEDLGNAIRKIRIDLGIPIELKKVRIYARESKRRQPTDIPKYCAIGTIKYSELDAAEPDGTLIYLKPALCDDEEPIDIFNYAQKNPGFPHESTGDQWFSESQFESYRMLGSHIVQQICRKEPWEDQWRKEVATGRRSPLDLLKAHVEDYLKMTNNQPPNGKPPWCRYTGARPDVDRPKEEKV